MSFIRGCCILILSVCFWTPAVPGFSQQHPGPIKEQAFVLASSAQQGANEAKIPQDLSLKDPARYPEKTSTWRGIKVMGGLFVIALIFVSIPFLPGILELVKPKDDKPLAINMNFSKDYKYFGRSFQKMLEEGLGTPLPPEPGEHTLMLSKPEKVQVLERKKVQPHQAVDEILYILKDFSSGDDVTLRKEIYVRGKCTIGAGNILRALYSEGDLVIGKKSSIVRWIDGDRNIEIQEGCRLGISVASSGRLALERHCTFNRMFGLPIMTYPAEMPELSRTVQVKNIGDMTVVITKKELIMPPDTNIPRDIIVHQKLVLRENSYAKANIKTYRGIHLEKGCRIEGDLFSEKDIIVEPGCTILGNIFSQGRVKLGNGVRISEEGRIKSVIGKKGVFLEGNAIIYGYIMSDGEGKVL